MLSILSCATHVFHIAIHVSSLVNCLLKFFAHFNFFKLASILSESERFSTWNRLDRPKFRTLKRSTLTQHLHCHHFTATGAISCSVKARVKCDSTFLLNCCMSWLTWSYRKIYYCFYNIVCSFNAVTNGLIYLCFQQLTEKLV